MNVINQEQVDRRKAAMYEKALSTIGGYNQLVKSIDEQGADLLFECLAVLEPAQIMRVTKQIAKHLARSVHNAFSEVYRLQNEEVRRKGVDGYELSFSEFVSEYQASEFMDDDIPTPMIVERAAYEAYLELHNAYLIAEKSAFGWRNDYVLQGLPWLSYTDDDGETWHNIMDLSEAMNRLDLERQMYEERRRREEREAISKIAQIGKRQPSSDEGQPSSGKRQPSSDESQVA